MSVVENIIGAVVIIAVLLIMGLLMTTNLMSRLDPLTGPSVRNYEYDLYNNNWHAAMNAVEPETGETMHSLLATSLIKFSKDIDYEGTIINIPSKLEEILDMVYGENNYYFEAYPIIDTIYFSFVLDGSESFEDEREMIRDNLEEIYQRVIDEQTEYEDLTLTFLIFIIEGEANAGSIFDHDTIDVRPFVIGKVQLDDTGVPHPDIAEDAYGNGGENYRTVYKSDWVSGIQYASGVYEDIALNRGYFNMHFILPLADEPATSAFPRSCLTLSSWNYVMCSICGVESGGECNTRGDEQIDYLLALDAFNPTINTVNRIVPLYAFECNYDYDSGWNGITVAMGYADNGMTPADEGVPYWCDYNACPGCSIDVDTGGVCFHPECQIKTQEQMERLASNTGGQVLDINDITNLGETIGDIADDAIDGSQILLGNPAIKLQETNKYVFNKDLHLRAGKTTKIILHVKQ